MGKKKEKLKVTVGWRESSIPGTFVAEANVSDMPAPVGTVYFRFSRENWVEILSTWVREDYRRRGVRSAINDQLTVWYPNDPIVTARGTETGTKFMKGYGYRKLANGTWIYRPKKKR